MKAADVCPTCRIRFSSATHMKHYALDIAIDEGRTGLSFFRVTHPGKLHILATAEQYYCGLRWLDTDERTPR